MTAISIPIHIWESQRSQQSVAVLKPSWAKVGCFLDQVSVLGRTVHASQLYLWVLDLSRSLFLFHEMYHLLYQPASCQLTFETLAIFFLLNFLLLLVQVGSCQRNKSFKKLCRALVDFTGVHSKNYTYRSFQNKLFTTRGSC